MKKIAVISQKGGAGKTTISINLAIAALFDKKSTAIFDLDPQASACGWGDSRDNEMPAVVSCQSARLESMLKTAEESEADLVILDTAPHSESYALQAARLADLIIIPCRPATLDLRAINNTIDLASLAKTPAIVVFNAIPPNSRIGEEAITLIKSQGIEVCSTSLGQRISYVHSITAGQGVMEYEPSGKAAKEIKDLYKSICKHVDMSIKRRVA